MRAFQKCMTWDGSPQGVPYEEKYVFLAQGQMSRADQRENLHDGRALSCTWVSPFRWRYLQGVSK